ncbi:MAG: DEAD/DEAH box helicase [Trueperaceae bacterium]|nr:DEAD/DEAH box helicase [Trueperaceae bacterium]
MELPHADGAPGDGPAGPAGPRPPWLRAAGSELIAHRRLDGREGRFEPLPDDLPPTLTQALAAAGVTRLYAHQREAIDALDAGSDVLLTTGTASGKSLAYQLPALRAQWIDEGATVLALYPTKALAHDQARAMASLAEATGLPPGTVAAYDGDTPSHVRARRRAEVRTLITNPDMLHAGILPHHTLWRRFLRGLDLVVVDEIHAYRGVFGGHLAGVLRRLLRVARHYGAAPRLLATSATIGNGAEHAAALLGRTPHVVARDDAPRAPREVLLVRPPMVDRALGMRRAPGQDAVRIAEGLVRAGRQVLVFAGSRQGAEEAVLQLRASVDGVRSYRSGLLARERRAIEAELRDGTARAVVATNALELGLDIGGVDAVVIIGYPGSAAAFWQQLGRAGRRDRSGVGALVLGSGPLDQYLARHPEHLFGAAPERALTDPDHPLLALDHLRCATFELPVEPHEPFGGYGPSDVQALTSQLEADGEVHRAGGRSYWIADRYPAQGVSLRSAGQDDVLLQDEHGVTVGTLDAPSARWMAHPGAIYLHDGRPHHVAALDLDQRVARLEPTDDRFLTRATRETRITPAGRPAERSARGATVLHGDVDVTETVTGYRRMRRSTRETLSRHRLQLPPFTMRTTAYAFTPHEDTVAALRAAGRWSNDPNAYGPDWPRVRARTLARDGHACRSCGAREGAGTALHVHHLVPVRAFARASEAHADDNLVTLCPACHHRAEQSVRVRSGLAAVAYVLRSLAPLRVMCDARDLGVLSDPASPVASGAPAVLVYETVPGGVGFAAELAARHEELIAAAHDLVTSCACDEGCPGCVGPAGEPGHAGKDEARALLAAAS